MTIVKKMTSTILLAGTMLLLASTAFADSETAEKANRKAGCELAGAIAAGNERSSMPNTQCSGDLAANWEYVTLSTCILAGTIVRNKNLGLPRATPLSKDTELSLTVACLMLTRGISESAATAYLTGH
jgi:hypothetical protein